MEEDAQAYAVGIMKTLVKEVTEEFDALVDQAVAIVKKTLLEDLSLEVQVFQFRGPHLSPDLSAYSPLGFLKLGLDEKLERGVHFLLIITEVDLTSSKVPYTLALPSQLTNVGIISTKRLSPSFWGEEPNPEVGSRRLAALMLHTLGHILTLNHHPSEDNVMYDFIEVQDLESMDGFTEEQIAKLKQHVPTEAHNEVGHGNVWRFALRHVYQERASIWHAVARANPLRLLTRMPAMITAGLSLIIVLFFSSEIWDVAGTVEFYQLVIFALVAMTIGTAVLYRAFTFGTTFRRDNAIAESTVITEAATLISLLLTLLMLFLSFLVFVYLGALTIFPQKLMETWPTADPVLGPLNHFKLSLFVASMGVLAGSLGGRAESRALVRRVLFIDEET
jgi:predicted Zn-dependent protease